MRSRGLAVRFIGVALCASSVEPSGFRLCKIAIGEWRNFHRRPRFPWRCAVSDHDYPLRGLVIGNGANSVDFHTPNTRRPDE